MVKNKDYFHLIRQLHTKEFPINGRSFRLSYTKHEQLPLFHLHGYSHIRLGFFYELLTKTLFGGEIIDALIQMNPGHFDYGQMKPDIENITDKIAIESKAVRTGHHLNLHDNQINRYINYCRTWPDRTVYFAMYRHTFRKIKSFYGNTSELFKKASGSTVALIVLPLPLIVSLWKNVLKNCGRHYEEPFFVTAISSKLLNQFIINPVAAIRQAGMWPGDFKTTRYLSPKKLKIGENSVTHFPIILIKQRERTIYQNDLPF